MPALGRRWFVARSVAKRRRTVKIANGNRLSSMGAKWRNDNGLRCRCMPVALYVVGAPGRGATGRRGRSGNGGGAPLSSVHPPRRAPPSALQRPASAPRHRRRVATGLRWQPVRGAVRCGALRRAAMAWQRMACCHDATRAAARGTARRWHGNAAALDTPPGGGGMPRRARVLLSGPPHGSAACRYNAPRCVARRGGVA